MTRLDQRDALRPAVRPHRRPARRLRAQPAAGPLRAGGLRAARPGGADVHPRRDLGRRGRARPAPPGRLRPAAGRPGRGDRGDEGRRLEYEERMVLLDAVTWPQAARGAARGGVRDLPREPPVAARPRARPQERRARDGRAGDGLHRPGRALRAGPLGGAGAALPDRRLPDPAPDRARGAPHPRAGGPGHLARGDGPADRLLAARRVGGTARPGARRPRAATCTRHRHRRGRCRCRSGRSR